MANPRETRIAELKAQIESAKAEIAQIQADEQAEVAEDSQLDGTLMNRNTDDAIAAYEADKKNERELTGQRNDQGDFVEAGAPTGELGSGMDLTGQNKKDKEEVLKKPVDEKDDSPLEVEVKLDPDNWLDQDEKTDEESGKMKFKGVQPVETFTSSREGVGEIELDGGRTYAEEDTSVERTMGFQADDGGNMSVDEKDDFWKTQEGYDKALEMYGSKPAWVKEPTMQWNPSEQEYEEVEPEEFEDLSRPSISADIKKLFG